MKTAPRISEDLCDEAKQYLAEIIAVMEDQEVITSMDVAAIELLGNTYHTYIVATKTLKREGYVIASAKGDIRAHPCVKIQLDSQIQLTKLMDSFGLNPKARKEIGKSKEKGRELSPMDVFLENIKGK